MRKILRYKKTFQMKKIRLFPQIVITLFFVYLYFHPSLVKKVANIIFKIWSSISKVDGNAINLLECILEKGELNVIRFNREVVSANIL